MEIKNQPSLHQTIFEYILEIDKDCHLKIGEVNNLAADLDRFVAFSVEKYLRGKAKHGGFLLDRQCLVELEMELVDAWQYLKNAQRQVNPPPTGL